MSSLPSPDVRVSALTARPAPAASPRTCGNRGRLAAAALSLVLAVGGCGGGGGGTDGGGGGTDPGGTEVFAPIDVGVLLPAGAPIDLTTTTVLSLLTDEPVAADGRSVATVRGDGRILAAVFDTDDEPVLVGFVSSALGEISVATTVEATLYFALGLYAMPVEVQETFWANVRNFEGFQATVEAAEALFLGDAGFFRGEAYRDLMEAWLRQIEGGPRTQKLDLRDNDVRSGLQLDEQPGDKVKVVNGLRRRCHAFLYKMRSTDLADMESVLITDVRAENPAARQAVASGPVSAYDSFVGTAQSAAAGKGIEFFRTESDPLDLGLSADEKEAVFHVRVIGPSFTPGALSATEESMLRELELKTLALDVVLPILFKLASQDDFLKELKSSPDLEALGELTKSTLAGLPGVADPISKGQFGLAFRGLLEGLVDGQLASAFLPIYTKAAEIIGKKGGLKGTELEAFTKKADKFNTYLKITDAILEINKYRELIAAVLQADMLEVFEVVSTRAKVTLSPRSGVVVQGEGLSLTADVQDTNLEGTAFEYTWSTSGQYGELRDGLGKSGTSFVSSQKTVEFFCPAGVFLPDGVQAIDVVNVKVAIKQGATTMEVGESAAAVEVRELGFEILPQDPELEGRESLTLFLRRTDGQDPFASEFFDYKVVWETQGEFGFFDATTTSVTSTTSGSAVYTCLEEEDEGTEEVTVRVYCRPKGSTEPYQFVDRVRTTIEIINDETVEIFYVPRFTHVKEIAPSLQGTPRFSVRHAFAVAPVEGAVRYSIKIVVWTPNDYVNYLGRGTSWNPDDTDMRDELDESRFVYFPSGGSQIPGAILGEQVAGYDQQTAMAKVTVTISNP